MKKQATPHIAAIQIDLQQHELEDLHKGMRELEATLGRSKAEKADARTLYEERVHAANARKNALERQLRSQAAAASEGAAAAPKIRELSQNLDKLQASKANAVRELRSCQVSKQSFLIVENPCTHPARFSHLLMHADGAQAARGKDAGATGGVTASSTWQ